MKHNQPSAKSQEIFVFSGIFRLFPLDRAMPLMVEWRAEMVGEPIGRTSAEPGPKPGLEVRSHVSVYQIDHRLSRHTTS